MTSILRAAAIAAAAALATNALAADWRPALVRSVGARPGADAGIDLDCAPVQAAEAATRVLVVSLRTGKSHYWRAFNLAADERFTAGEEVVVDLAGCRVAHRARPADAASSAP